MTRLVQFTDETGQRKVGRVDPDGKEIQVLRDVATVYDLAHRAMAQDLALETLCQDLATSGSANYDAIWEAGRLLPPLDHPDPARCLVTGTGLSHLGSAKSRDSMHAKLDNPEAELSDSMKMFKWGVEGGKPAPGDTGVQPEWFYKGDGSCIAAPGAVLELPGFALDGGEEAEIAGLYIIADDGTPARVGFALGNEFSDHVMERQNYLYLAHSKLRACAMGPELLLGELPADVQGTVRVLRGGEEIWSGDFASGEANMSHSIANLEHHHFKYARFRRPGDVHCHFFGTATLSYAEGIKTRPGDIFEISAPAFGRPLRNEMAQAAGEGFVAVRAL